VPAAEVDSGLFLVSYQTIKIHVAARSQECLNRPIRPAASFGPGAAQPARRQTARQLSRPPTQPRARVADSWAPLSSVATSPLLSPLPFPPFVFLSSHPRAPPWKGGGRTAMSAAADGLHAVGGRSRRSSHLPPPIEAPSRPRGSNPSQLGFPFPKSAAANIGGVEEEEAGLVVHGSTLSSPSRSRP
jgi:hypothetical protein